MRLIRHPVLCNYYLTYRCNARCSFCDIWEKPSPYATEAAVAANLADLKRLGVKVIDFTGGEPLLHPQVGSLLHMARQMGFITTLTTNTLLYPKKAESLRGAVSMLHFSLDYPDAERHNRSRGVACHEHLMQSLDIATQLGERPDILYTVTDDSVEGIAEVYHHITRPRGLILILNPLFSYGDVGGSVAAAHYPELQRWARRPGVYLNSAFLHLRARGGNSTHRPVCRAASSTVVISPENALVLPCYHLGLEHIPIEGHLHQLWHSPSVQHWVAQEGRLPGCQGCAINCYMQPSFAVEMNRYFWAALPSTLKYSWEKWVLPPTRRGTATYSYPQPVPVS